MGYFMTYILTVCIKISKWLIDDGPKEVLGVSLEKTKSTLFQNLHLCLLTEQSKAD